MDNTCREASISETNITAWCYWEGPMPPYIQACIIGMRHAAAVSGCQFNLLTPQTLHHYPIDLPEGFSELSHAAQRSDVLAALVLARYGGLFLDADIVFLNTMHEIWNKVGNKRGVLFRNREQRIATWALLAGPGHGVFKDWCKAQARLLGANPQRLSWNALGSPLLTDIVKQQPAEDFHIIDAASSVHPVSWDQQADYYGQLAKLPHRNNWRRGWQPFIVLNNKMLPAAIKTATEHELITSQGPLGELLQLGRRARRKLILGLGTGRCGTTSFASLLSINGIDSSHEMPGKLHWRYDNPAQAEAAVSKRIDKILSRASDCVADTAFFYLPHLEYIQQYCLKRDVDVRFVALRRERSATVSSYAGWVSEKNANHWVENPAKHYTPNKWDACYPSYPPLPLGEAIGRYWDEYYVMADAYKAKYPDCFSVFDIEILNTQQGLKQLCAFIGEALDQPEGVGIHENAYNTPIPVYWINLQGSAQRRSTMQSRLDATGVHHYRIAAVNGYDNNDFNNRIVFANNSHFLKNAGFRDRHNPISRAEYACTASHLSAIAEAYAQGVPYAVISEDDVQWTKEGIANLKFIIARLPKDCAILQLASIGPAQNLRLLYKAFIDHGQLMVRRNEFISQLVSLGKGIRTDCNGTQAYIITKRAMARLLNLFWRDGQVYFPFPENTSPGNVGAVADELVYHFVEGEGNSSYVLTRPFLLWDDIGSDIHSDHIDEHQRALREVRSILQRKTDLSDWPVITYWINRESSSARKKRMRLRLERCGLKHIRVKAIDGDNAQELQTSLCFNGNKTLPDEHRPREISPRELACSVSHLKAIRRAYNDGCEIALIMEDDVELGLLSREWLDSIIAHMPDDCGILQLVATPEAAVRELDAWSLQSGQAYARKNAIHCTLSDIPGLEQLPVHGACAYLIRRASMARLIETRSDNNKLCLPADTDITHNAALLADRLIYRDASGEGLSAYVLCHSLFTCESLDSELHSDHLAGHADCKRASLQGMLQTGPLSRPNWLKLV